MSCRFAWLTSDRCLAIDCVHIERHPVGKRSNLRERDVRCTRGLQCERRILTNRHRSSRGTRDRWSDAYHRLPFEQCATRVRPPHRIIVSDRCDLRTALRRHCRQHHPGSIELNQLRCSAVAISNPHRSAGTRCDCVRAGRRGQHRLSRPRAADILDALHRWRAPKRDPDVAVRSSRENHLVVRHRNADRCSCNPAPLVKGDRNQSASRAIGCPDRSVEPRGEVGKHGARKVDRRRDGANSGNVRDLRNRLVDGVSDPHTAIGASSEEPRRRTYGDRSIHCPNSTRQRDRTDVVIRLVDEPQ